MAGFFGGFYGRQTVVMARRKMQIRTGKVAAATLYRRTTGDTFGITQPYLYSYVYPINATTGLGGGGFPNRDVQAVLFQEGETYAPRADDKLNIAGETWQILSVNTRLNATDNYAVHDLTITDDFRTA